MPRLLLRFSRNHAAWDDPNLDQLIKINFRDSEGRPDLRPSVYEVEAPSEELLKCRVVRICAEHTASFLSPHRKPTPLHDVKGFQPYEANCGRTEFDYANGCHREVVLRDEAMLREFVDALRTQHSALLTTVSRDELCKYIASVHWRTDWLDAARRNDRVRAWVDAANKSQTALRDLQRVSAHERSSQS